MPQPPETTGPGQDLAAGRPANRVGERWAGDGGEPLADRNDWPTTIAIAGVGVGWFVLDAVALRAGHFIAGFRFYDLAALMYRPSRLLTGVRDSDLYLTVPFFLLCTAALGASLAPRFTRRRAAWFGLFAPLALMLVCAIVLYDQASKDVFVVPPETGEIGQALAHLGHAVARRTGAVLSQHLTLGAGTWVSAIGAVYLAVTGVRRLRAAPPGSTPRPG